MIAADLVAFSRSRKVEYWTQLDAFSAPPSRSALFEL
jgi:hypothetical protein